MAARAPENIRELLKGQVARSPDKDFLFCESNDRVLTYRQFDDEVDRAADTLQSVGIGKGDRVSLLLTNRPEYLIFYFACFKLGAWAGPINALLKSQEIEFIIAHSEASVVVTQPDLLPNLDQAREHLGPLRHAIVIEGNGSGFRVQG